MYDVSMGKLIHRKDRKQEAADRLARRTELLVAARSAFLSQPKGELSLETLDRAAGQRTGTASMFFGSLEGVAFRLLKEELSSWLEEVGKELGDGGSELQPDEIAGRLASTLMERALLCRLLALLTFLADRHSLELGLLREMEVRRLRELEETGRMLESRCSLLKAGDGLIILRRALLFAGALEAQINPPSGLLLIMSEEQFSLLYPDAGEELRQLLEAVLSSMVPQGKTGAKA